MKTIFFLFLSLAMLKGFAFECRVDVVNPKTKDIQKVPFEVEVHPKN
jgi:hypothetical protein